MLTTPLAALMLDVSSAVTVPATYTGCQVRLDEIAELIRIADEDPAATNNTVADIDGDPLMIDNVLLRATGVVTILGVALPATEIYLSSDKADRWFWVQGRTYTYEISVFDEFSVEVHVHGTVDDDMELRSIMYPETREQLLRALQTVVDDCRP